ncbi:MotA/TolQ/ExbB proton channel family protein [Frateuria aurantia]
MLQIVMAGGWAVLPILLCSAWVLAVAIERAWVLRRQAVMPPGLGDEVARWVQSGIVDAAHLQALSAASPLGQLLAAAAAVRDRPRDQIKERLEDTGRHVVFRLERHLNGLGTIALIAPLLGLLGTVIGLVRMFMTVMGEGVGDPSRMAGGIGEALICTAGGLVVAIPAYVLHRWYRARIDGYVVDMEQQASRLLDVITATASRRTRSRSAAPAAG